MQSYTYTRYMHERNLHVSCENKTEKFDGKLISVAMPPDTSDRYILAEIILCVF